MEDVRAYWGAKADDWTAQADGMAAQADKYNRLLLDAADLRPGHRVLDLASGAGEPAFTARTAVGDTGMVVATDLAPEMMRGLRARDIDRRLTPLAADMARLPFAEASFDRVLCRFGVMFVPDPARAMRDVARVTRPGGKAAFMVWGPRSDQTLFTCLSGAVEDVYGVPPDRHHFQIFRFGAPGALARVLEAAGFHDIRDAAHRFNTLAPLDKPFWRPQVAMGFGHIVKDRGPKAMAVLDAAMRRRLEPLREPDGYRMTALLRVVTGTSEDRSSRPRPPRECGG
jgi:SAM-dependent methyltransferase